MLPTTIKPPKRLNLIHTYRQIIRTYSTDQSSPIPTLNNPVQAYISQSRDPYLNLSIEHYLFSNTPPGSKILFIYVNRPCVVIGRNQNPWVEVNLSLLKDPKRVLYDASGTDATGVIDLVRRRSGGGAVFHDEGNVNWSVVVDASDFTRDRHAEMVVRGLRGLGVYRARVNERHDVVIDLGKASRKLEDVKDTHVTPYLDESGNVRSLKVSGSAFRLSRGRALHHGTALVGSRNVGDIGRVLRSPARKFIKAKGVESVNSDVGNIGIPNETFEKAVLEQFEKLYEGKRHGMVPGALGSEMMEVESVRKGVEELAVGGFV
jgi:lipoate-protein ligase A